MLLPLQQNNLLSGGVTEATASASGTGTATGIGASTAAATGSASGTGAATGIGASTAAAYGLAGDDSTLLLHFDGSDGSTTFTDSSKPAHVFTAVGNAQIDTAQSKFGGASGLFDGTGDYLTGDGSSDFSFGTGDFTIDFWVRFNTLAVGNFPTVYDGRAVDVSIEPAIYLNTGNVLSYFANNSDRITGSSLTTGVWYHIAVTRSGTSTRMFLDGVQEGSTYTDTNNYSISANRPLIAANQFPNGATSNYVDGWVEELRIIKGRAAWTANFVPRVAAYESGGGRALAVGESAASDAFASGTGTATGVGASTAASTASASGNGAAAAAGQEIKESIAAASGTGAAAAIGASTAASAASASGTGTGTSVGASTAASVASATGTGAAAAVSAEQGSVAAAAGAGAASGAGASTASAVGTAAGVGSAEAVGASSTVYNFPIGRSLDSDYGIRRSRLGERRRVIGR